MLGNVVGYDWFCKWLLKWGYWLCKVKGEFGV